MDFSVLCLIGMYNTLMTNTLLYNYFDFIITEEVEELISSLGKLTGMPIGIEKTDETSYSKKFCKKSDYNPICILIQSTSEGLSACHSAEVEKCIQKSYHGICFYCHAGLVDFKIQIRIEDQHVATISCGQLLSKPQNEKRFKEICNKLKDIPVNKKELRKAYFKSPYTSPDKIKAVFKFLEFFAKYCGEVGRRLKTSHSFHKYPEILKAEDYIKVNFRNTLRLPEVADYVGLSNSYFSRLFVKVTGDTFTDYLQKFRVGEGKNLLYNTDWTITKIAFDLGCSSIHYFYNLFYKFENCSPSSYRKQYCNK